MIEEVASRLRSDPGLHLDKVPLRLALEEGTLEMDGEVPSVAIKRGAVQVAASVPGVVWVADRLCVEPAERMEDGALRDHVVNALLEEPALADCAIRKRVKDGVETPRQAPGTGRGDICVLVEDGVVTLDGEVPTRAHKRLAGVLAWWVPGTRDVVDGLGLLSPEKDNDDEISDAVRTALEKDPFVDASQVRVRTKEGRVELMGMVSRESERDIAEHDAWFVFGVVDVVNTIEVEVRP